MYVFACKVEKWGNKWICILLTLCATLDQLWSELPIYLHTVHKGNIFMCIVGK